MRNAALLWLRKVDDESRVLEIVIGPIEAEAISLAQQGVIPPRPLTHNLLLTTIESVGLSLTEVRITNIENGTFFAELVLSNGIEISARPSDAIALALRAQCPILVSAEVYDLATREIQPEEEEEDSEEEIEAFRNFLEGLNPDDFDTQP
ncbi:MAG: hypothetical protein RIS09_755 [Actinomycetota bacterium]